MPNEFYIVNSATGRIVDGFPSFAEAERECAWWCEQRQRVYVVRELPALSFHEMLAYNRRQPPAREALRRAAEALAARLHEMMVTEGVSKEAKAVGDNCTTYGCAGELIYDKGYPGTWEEPGDDPAFFCLKCGTEYPVDWSRASVAG